ncbi:MAG: outer membrane beta-barrel protein [Candidatus Aminicenantes bacterium]|nr:MAG: outer membrane beta-barrel protein [Candidatus Aminicenantes bacterium]
MGMKLSGKSIISLVIVFILVLPFISQAEQKQRIKVVAQNASVRMQPNTESEVILSPPVGSTFEVEQKIGDWYEIKFSSEIGVLITGYINSRFVEVIEAEPVRVEKKEPIRKPARPTAKPRPARAGGIKINIMAGGMFSLYNDMFSRYFSYPYRGEEFIIEDYLESSSSIGFTGGLGVFVTPNIELTGSMATFSKAGWGELFIDVPSPFFFDDYKSDYAEYIPNVKKTIFSFGINIHPIKSGPIDIYFGGGGSYIKATVDIMEDFIYTETQDFVALTHSVVIDEVLFEETDITAFGFNGRVGINYRASNNLYIFGEGRHIIASKDVPHPFDDTVTIEGLDLGGTLFLGGIRIVF